MWPFHYIKFVCGRPDAASPLNAEETTNALNTVLLQVSAVSRRQPPNACQSFQFTHCRMHTYYTYMLKSLFVQYSGMVHDISDAIK